jgi:hypothetical protein
MQSDIAGVEVGLLYHTTRAGAGLTPDKKIGRIEYVVLQRGAAP